MACKSHIEEPLNFDMQLGNKLIYVEDIFQVTSTDDKQNYHKAIGRVQKGNVHIIRNRPTTTTTNKQTNAYISNSYHFVRMFVLFGLQFVAFIIFIPPPFCVAARG